MKNTLACLLAAFMAVCAASAQNVPALVIGADPASLATGQTAVAVSADAFALENNAAAMSLSGSTFRIGGSYGIWAPDIADNTIVGLGAWWKMDGSLALGLYGKGLIDKSYEIINADGLVSGFFRPKDIVAGLGLSYKLAEGFSAGLTGKFLYSSIAKGSDGKAVAADVSLAYAADSFSAGLGIFNVGSKISYGSGSYALPSVVRGGAAFSRFGLRVSGEFGYYLAGGMSAGAGLEYGFRDIAFVRAGYHYGNGAMTIPSFASIGIGAKYFGIGLDATYLFGSDALAGTLLFGLSYSF